MRRSVEWPLVCSLGLALLSGAVGGCNAPARSNPIESESQHEKSPAPPEIAAVATAALGSEAQVLSFGDLAGNGRRQVLAANRTQGSSNTQQGIRITRAAVLEQVGTKWVEV